MNNLEVLLRMGISKIAADIGWDYSNVVGVKSNEEIKKRKF